MAHETTRLHQPRGTFTAAASASTTITGWRHQRLSQFTFLMSAHRMPVCVATMLGDATYLRRQLRLACTTDDAALQQLAIRMLRELAADPSARHATDPWCH